MRNINFLATFVLISLFIFQQEATAETKYIRFGNLIDGTGKVLKNAVVVVEDDRIKNITNSKLPFPANAEVIDLTKYTGIPALIDVHTHLAGLGGAPSLTPVKLPRHPAIDMFLAQKAARATLESGVTTVRNLGALQFMDIAMRDLINMGAMVGPRMLVSGPGVRRSASPGLYIPEATADGADQISQIVRELIASGVDVIKIVGSTGAGLDLSGDQTFSFEELKSATDAAHNLGRKVAVHTYGAPGARDAIRAGVDSIEHATDMDNKTIKEMVKRGTFYVPTIDHNRWYLENKAQTPKEKEQLNNFIRRNFQTTRRAIKAGVKIAMGSDGGAVNMIGETTRELGWFVKAGMTPQQALAAATTNAAMLLGKEKELGTIAPGYFADIVAVEGNPLKDINVVINNVRWVMKGGIVMVDKTKVDKEN